jgi:hypothetical protein
MPPDGGTLPRPSESSSGADVDLFGTSRSNRRPGQRAWRIEIKGRGAQLGERATDVQVALIDAETGKRLAAQTFPFSWIVDVALGSTSVVNLREGEWS